MARVAGKTAALVVAGIILLSALAGCGERPPPNIVNSTDDVVGRVIGALYGSPSIVLAEEMGTGREYQSGEDMINDLRVGLLDCAIMESTSAQELIEDSSGVRILDDPLLEYDMRFAVAKENAALLREVNAALVALSGNGTLRGLLSKYFAGRNYTYVPPDNIEPHPGYIVLAVSPENHPYSSMDWEGNFTGLDIEVAQAVCDQLGVELRIQDYNSRDLVTAVWFGWADLALGWVPIEGEDNVAISEAYASSTQVVIVRR